MTASVAMNEPLLGADDWPTVRNVLKMAMEQLTLGGLDSARLLAERLVSHVVRCGRLELPLKAETSLHEEQLRQVWDGLRRLTEGEPIQYILGEVDFMGHPLKVDRRVLIPRPETEELTDRILHCQPLWRWERPWIADVGTGSGCIVIALALANPNARYEAVDFDSKCLELAEINARAHDVHHLIRFRVGDLLDGFPENSLDAVVSNPPYVRTSELDRLMVQVRCYEPRPALDGGADGLQVIHRLIGHSARILKPGGILFMEIGDDQGRPVTERLETSAFVGIQIMRDLAGKDRFVQAEKAET